ncbi:MAG: beta-N-acetylhexosaminidase [Oligoflexia bacterium]|nr:beta-N-acetylhexosaminidase [Oligoflexia bacterium]
MAIGEQTSLADRKRRAGQRMIVGFGGLDAPVELREFCAQARPAGFILFARNVEEPAQVRELNQQLRSLVPAQTPALISVDQEGGRVQRVKATAWPRARVVGNADDVARTQALARAMGDELRAMGFHIDWAPVADVDSNPANPVIGDRAFSSDPDAVARHSVAFLKGLEQAGIAGCAKHFPGHGDTSQDSHTDLPVVERPPPDLDHCELVPFRAVIAAGAPLVMTAHVRFPAWDVDLPATMSQPIIQGLLRQRLGYTGVVVSDDLEMKALRGRYPLDMQLDLACRATVDLFLCCADPHLQWQAFESLVRLQEADKLHDDLAIDAVRRLHGLRRRFLSPPTPMPALSTVGCIAHRDLALDMESRGRT